MRGTTFQGLDNHVDFVRSHRYHVQRLPTVVHLAIRYRISPLGLTRVAVLLLADRTQLAPQRANMGQGRQEPTARHRGRPMNAPPLGVSRCEG